MQEYIYTERNGIYIIDLQKTVKKFEEAYMFVRELSADERHAAVRRHQEAGCRCHQAKRRSDAECTTSTSGGRAV